MPQFWLWRDAKKAIHFGIEIDNEIKRVYYGDPPKTIRKKLTPYFLVISNLPKYSSWKDVKYFINKSAPVGFVSKFDDFYAHAYFASKNELFYAYDILNGKKYSDQFVILNSSILFYSFFLYNYYR